MPGGVPVATVALDGAKNAGILAAQIVGTYDEKVAEDLQKYKDSLRQKVEESVEKLKERNG
jgi:5-(carboxyamino)imidazole ribonucleotide mutase